MMTVPTEPPARGGGVEEEDDSMMIPPPSNVEGMGRVVRLHFTCHAELPMGSFLRVTGSQLWAPGVQGSDSVEAGPVLHQVAKEQGVGNPESMALYTSSVEMVTTPDEYPIWRTRTPVVCVIHHARKTIQHHYYRYLVVSPGGHGGGSGSGSGGMDDADEDEEDIDEDVRAKVSTSNEAIGSTAVMQWEDPFGSTVSSSYSTPHVSNSMVSLTNSVITAVGQTTDLRNLPYRTRDVNVQTASSAVQGVAMDYWNARDDESFRGYLIREAIHQENRRKLKPSITEGSESNMEEDTDGLETPPVVFPENHRLLFICFHLPVVVVQNQSSGEWRASWSESILAKTEGSQILQHYERALWVGTVTTHPPLATDEDKEKVRKILEDMSCIPIFLDPAVRQSHYYGFCKQVLWPAFHNIDLLDLSTSGWLVGGGDRKEESASDWDQSRLNDWWNAYNQVNGEFFRLIAGMVRPGDILWIHDYHLSLLPQQLSEWETEKYGRRVTRKVFFLHIPFPTSQIFRELECGERILRGMLHADVVGFHAFDHARHFLNAAKRILGLNYESMAGGLIGVDFQGSNVLVSMSNVSIEPRMVDAALMLPSVQSGKDALKNKHEGRIIIGGLDIGQRLSGVALKLLAYERLLQDYPSWQNRVVMVQRLLLAGSRKADEQLTTREVRVLVKRIQERFGPAVIDYEEVVGTSLPMDQRLALWKASDVLMLTPIREGLNHWPMEYIYAHKEPETPGVVIASEFSAISSILNGALRVNPYDIKMTITTIDKALSMDLQEREGRRYRDIDFVSSSPSDKWVKNVLRDLRDATARTVGTSEASSQVSTPYATPLPNQQMLVDSTASYLARETAAAFCRLSTKALKRAYDATRQRVIFLDFNGTIVLKEPPGKYLKREILGSSGNKPPPRVLEALSLLCEDPKNTVYVVSGDSSDSVLSALGHIQGLGLAISNGGKYAPPIRDGESGRRWLTFDLGVDWDAVKKVALPVLSKYTARSNGSFVKMTSFSIGWSYYSCDPEWGSMQASHLVQELESELRAFDVRFVTLKGIVEIVPRILNKGLVVKRVLRDTAAEHPEGIDFVLCFGDDISDEKMFTSVFSFLAEAGSDAHMDPGPPVMADDGSTVDAMEIAGPLQTRDPSYCFTVAVGKKPSHASVYVNDAQTVADALVMLARGEVPGGAGWASDSASSLFL